MLLPVSYATAVALALFAMACWGLWAHTWRMAGKWRFELYWFDASFGAMLTVALASLTIGSMGSEITAIDNLTIVSKRQLLWAFLGGGVANIGLMLTMAAMAVAGIAVGYSIAMPAALATGVVWMQLASPAGRAGAVWFGAALLVASAALAVFAHRAHKRSFVQEVREAGETKRRIVQRRGAWRAAIFAAAGGLAMGGFYPLAELARDSDIAMGPFPIALIACAGLLLSTFVCNLYFINLPVEGRPLSVRAYFAGSARQHLLGLLGGAIWALGAIALLLSLAAQEEVRLSRSLATAIAFGAGPLGLIGAMLFWKEFAGAAIPVRVALGLSVVLFAVGAYLTAAA
jgi:glucose uptake protein